MKYEVTWTRTAVFGRGNRAVFIIEAGNEQNAIHECEVYLRASTMDQEGHGPDWECNMVNAVTEKRVDDPRKGCRDFAHLGETVPIQDERGEQRMKCSHCGQILS